MVLGTGDVMVQRTDVIPIFVVVTFQWRSQALNSDLSITK